MYQIADTWPMSPFSIKDMMLTELLCQAGLLTDEQVLRAFTLAKALHGTVGSAICQLGWLTASELFTARRLLNRYLNDHEQLESTLRLLRDKVSPKARAKVSSIVPKIVGFAS